MTDYIIIFLGLLLGSCLSSLVLWSVLKPWEKPLRQAHLEEPEEDARIEGPPSRIRIVAP
jgi:hypothetical protein